MRTVLLLEPGHPNKYPPLGLMKLAAYHKRRGDRVTFAKHGYDAAAAPAPLLGHAFDRVYVSTLFTFEWQRTRSALIDAVSLAGGQPSRVFAGGVAASLVPDVFRRDPQTAAVRLVTGVLDRPPRQSLGLQVSDFDYDEARTPPIDGLPPDYAVLADSAYRYPVSDAYLAYTTRGCIRNCSFCGVPKLEGAQRDAPGLSRTIAAVDAASGPKKDLLLLDNNVTASPRFRDIVAEIRALGFQAGAVLDRGGRTLKRRVDFNQGVDARLLARTPAYLRDLASLCIDPLRIAFDHTGLSKAYTASVRAAADAGIRSLANYMLYNFHDDPEDLYRRMALNVKLGADLGLQIWGFPMRFQPVHLTDRSHVGPGWSRYLLRSMQIVLQATHGVVSGSATYFTGVFGDSAAAFHRLLTLPHAFIAQRTHYASGPGQPLQARYLELRNRLSAGEETELQAFLAPHTHHSLARHLATAGTPRRLQDLLCFHTLHPDTTPPSSPHPGLPLDKQVEDAFINDL